MNRDKLPMAWVAHANGQLLGTAALRVHDLEGREDLTPWLGGVFVGSHFRRRGIRAELCAAVEDGARSRATQTLHLFTLDKQAWYSRLGWTILGPCVWQHIIAHYITGPLQAAADGLIKRCNQRGARGNLLFFDLAGIERIYGAALSHGWLVIYKIANIIGECTHLSCDILDKMPEPKRHHHR